MIPPLQARPAQRIDGGSADPVVDSLAEETAIALHVNGEPQLVLLATPQDLDDLALGFALSEGWIDHPTELRVVDRLHHASGIVLQLAVPEARALALRERRRSLAARSGCGLCGVESLEDAMRPPRRVADRVRLRGDTLLGGMAALAAAQPLNARCGALHAAAALVDGALQAVREDVGRHNALDKTLGALAVAGQRADAVLLTSRASYELVHKAAQCGVEVLATVSAPTALAVRLADEAGLTLVGFAREQRFTVYSQPWRILP
jgi:FdhD protein